MNHLIDPFNVPLNFHLKFHRFDCEKNYVGETTRSDCFVGWFGGGKELQLESPTSNHPKSENIRLNHWNVIPGERIDDVNKNFNHIGFVYSYRFMCFLIQSFCHDRMIQHFWPTWSNFKSSFHVENKTNSWHWTCFLVITVLVDGGIIFKCCK